MKTLRLGTQVLIVMLVFAACFPLVLKSAFSMSPVYFTVEPKALSPLTDKNSSIYGLEVPATPSAIGDNFTVSLHLYNATITNVPRGINGLEIHFNFGNILTYAVPTNFTDYVGLSGGVLIAPVLYGFTPGFYAANGTRIPSPPYTDAVMYVVAAGTTGGVWNGADGLIANITFRIVKQPQSNEPSISFSLDYSYVEYDTTTVDPSTGEILVAYYFPDSISGNLTLDSNYTPPTYYTLTVQQNPPNSGTLIVRVNGVNQTSPYTFVNGTVAQVTATPNIDYKFSNWTLDGSNAGTVNPYNVTMNGNHTIAANFQKKYYLTVISPYDSPDPASGWFDPGANITESVTSPVAGPSGTRYECTGWTGAGSVPASGNNTHLTFTINANSTVTWNWKTQFNITFNKTGVSSDSTGTIVTIDGVEYNYSTLPILFWWDSSSQHIFSFLSPVTTNASKQYIWISTSGLSNLQNGSLTISNPGNITGNFKTQYYLTVKTDPNGIAVIPGEGWYDPTQNVTLNAPPITNYQFNYWDIDGTTQNIGTNSTTIQMNTSHTAIAYYVSALPGSHDIAITDVTVLKTVVGQGLSLKINVTAANQGSYTENFNVTVYLNQTIVASIQNINLPSLNQTTITSACNTTGLAYGNYTVSAYAWPVSGEAEIMNNNRTGNNITVTIPGDINADFKVNLVDLVLLANAYGSNSGNAKWNPNADINGNGAVDLSDLVLMANHYGQHYP